LNKKGGQGLHIFLVLIILLLVNPSSSQPSPISLALNFAQI